MEDLVLTAEQDYASESPAENDHEAGEINISTKTLYEWVPLEVLGNGWLVAEPPWQKLRKMDFLTFYTGIQKRNWTSRFYDETAIPWRLAFYKVSSTLLMSSVTRPHPVVYVLPDPSRFRYTTQTNYCVLLL